jgi:hypothetical protein
MGLSTGFGTETYHTLGWTEVRLAKMAQLGFIRTMM